MKKNTNLWIPHPVLSLHLSRAGLGLLLATIILALLIAFSTYRNINRSQDMIQSFLLMKGETVLRSLEAGSRTSMMHHNMGNGDPLHTLIFESIRDSDIAFIILMDDQGNLLDTTNDDSFRTLSKQEIEKITSSRKPIISEDKEQGVFTISQLFEPNGYFFQNKNSRMGMMMSNPRFKPEKRIITIGLFTKEFDAARKRDMQHTVFMGAILFLVGCAGLYVLFLYQEMRIARTTLADLKIYTDNVIESMPAGLLTLDMHDRIISCNRKAEEILGRQIDEIHGTILKHALPNCNFDTRTIGSELLDHEAEYQTADGRCIPVKVSGSPLVNEDGEKTGTVLIIKDMSFIIDMEQQLERSRNMAALGKMAAGIAHEIRNPLGTLRGFAHYFGALPDATKESKSYAELMKSEVDRLNHHVSALLQFARPREPNFSTVNLDALIAKIAVLTEVDFSENQLNFHYQCNTNIRIQADSDQLLQVLMNLLQNSVAATPAGGEVSLLVQEDDHHVRITVKDTGKGMTDEEQQKMFDPFFTTKSDGTGLGLAVSHQIVGQHNGTFSVTAGPGEGTAISMILPKQGGNIG